MKNSETLLKINGNNKQSMKNKDLQIGVRERAFASTFSRTRAARFYGNSCRSWVETHKQIITKYGMPNNQKVA